MTGHNLFYAYMFGELFGYGFSASVIHGAMVLFGSVLLQTSKQGLNLNVLDLKNNVLILKSYGSEQRGAEII